MKGEITMGTKREKRWNALDESLDHPLTNIDPTNMNRTTRNNKTKHSNKDNQEVIKEEQQSVETITIRNSADVTVQTTDTQVAASLQVALQAAIEIIINISIADGENAEKVIQELFQKTQIKQYNFQELLIDNSQNVRVTTTDTDAAISIQVLLQVLLALVTELDIL